MLPGDPEILDRDRLIAFFWSLNARERQVLYHVVDGMTVRRLADYLELSPKTVRQYIRVIVKKAEAFDAVQEGRREGVQGSARWETSARAGG